MYSPSKKPVSDFLAASLAMVWIDEFGELGMALEIVRDELASGYDEQLLLAGVLHACPGKLASDSSTFQGLGHFGVDEGDPAGFFAVHQDGCLLPLV